MQPKGNMSKESRRAQSHRNRITLLLEERGEDAVLGATFIQIKVGDITKKEFKITLRALGLVATNPPIVLDPQNKYLTRMGAAYTESGYEDFVLKIFTWVKTGCINPTQFRLALSVMGAKVDLTYLVQESSSAESGTVALG